ncbi:hypothetical protein KCP76_02310 [Salmonella enterica subsp. enterica serovar Weltevreden]|nr:hypothetical protein KCP76_02310 [Salmonella enterica subsp. enterica serovar Weltevreden]
MTHPAVLSADGGPGRRRAGANRSCYRTGERARQMCDVLIVRTRRRFAGRFVEVLTTNASAGDFASRIPVVSAVGHERTWR